MPCTLVNPTTVYRLFGATKGLLYVGSTPIEDYVAAHEMWRIAESAEFQHYEIGSHLAGMVLLDAIETEHPLYVNPVYAEGPGCDRQVTTLYRFYDALDRLLYVGITSSFGHRIQEHAEDKWWWRTVRSAMVEHYETRGLAATVETKAIRSEDPLYNIADHPNPRYDLTAPINAIGHDRWCTCFACTYERRPHAPD
jgi:predicted GIY-YIG superfamily endonuclease